MKRLLAGAVAARRSAQPRRGDAADGYQVVHLQRRHLQREVGRHPLAHGVRQDTDHHHPGDRGTRCRRSAGGPAPTQDRVLGALEIVKQNNPGVKTVITMPTDRTGPNSWGKRLITRAKELGAPIDTWAVMPFDWGSGGDVLALTKSAVDGLKNHVKATFGLSDDAAYRRSGLSSMNGKTDTGETVTPQNLRDIVTWANSRHLARVSFWAVNRDRGNCGAMSSSCSGINQQTCEFTKAPAKFTG